MTPEELRRRKELLSQRLQDGYVRIGEAETQGRDVTAWEAFWSSLLSEFEDVCEQLEKSEGATAQAGLFPASRDWTQ